MRTALVLIVALLPAVLTGCKLVHESEKEQVLSPGPEGDDIRNAARLDETFDSRLLPHVRDGALPVADLRAALAGGLDAAGQAHGNRGSGMGSAWNFPVRGEGRVVAANLDTSARTVLVDTDVDGAGDVTVQLGPVIRGTALRDVAPFYRFDDFRDQIEFAKLARAINDRLRPMIAAPEGDPVGRQVTFVGVVPLRTADEAMVVTPVDLTFAP